MGRGQLAVQELSGGKGIGYRPEIAAELLCDPRSVDFIEVVAEACFAQERTHREAVALSEVWPVVPHGVKLSLGSAEGIDLDRARRLGMLATELRAPVITEHVAITSAGGREIGHLAPIPRSIDVACVVARNVARARSKLPEVPLLLENIAVPFGFSGDVLTEPDFYSEIVERTGCDLLLDVANLYANALNAGRDPIETVLAFPLERVGMIHLAGGLLEDEFYYDTHAHAVPDGVLDLLAEVFARSPGGVPVVLERDANFDGGLAPLVGELDRAQQIRNAATGRRVDAGDAASARRVHGREPRAASAAMRAESAALAREQAELACLLVRQAPPSGPLAASIGLSGLERARRILERKRVEDALPVLPRLSRRAAAVWPMAERTLGAATRGVRLHAIADALAIARAVEKDACRSVADDALRDRLVLETRFVAHKDGLAARIGPYVSRATLSSGSVVWAMKGFGAAARVRLHEGAARSDRTREKKGATRP